MRSRSSRFCGMQVTGHCHDCDVLEIQSFLVQMWARNRGGELGHHAVCCHSVLCAESVTSGVCVRGSAQSACLCIGVGL